MRFPFVSRLRPAPRQSCTLCVDGQPHQVFITAPPGWGSVMECSPETRRHGLVVRDNDEIRELRAERGSHP